MTRIDSIIELFALVIFCDLSVANPPKRGDGGSSSSAAKESEPCIYGLNSLVRVKPSGNMSWRNPRVYVEHRNDATKFKFKLLGAYDENILEHTSAGHNTNLAFFYGNRMKILAWEDVDALYHLNFEEDDEANVIVENMLSNDKERFKKCTGKYAYKVEKLYKTSAGPLIEVAEKLCIFKTRTGSITKFFITRTEPKEDEPITLCVFRPEDFTTVKMRSTSNKLELRFRWHGDIMEPRYVLESPKPDDIEYFFESP